MYKPVAWMSRNKCIQWADEEADLPNWTDFYCIPLYTHPVKEQKCIVKDCENHKHEGGFVGDLCKPCHQFITTGEGIYSQAYRNSNPVKELTDEEILEVWRENERVYPMDRSRLLDRTRACIKKASEK